MPVLVLFVDCLRPDETKQYMAAHDRGLIESGIPRVTPQVLGGILTGKKPPHSGILCPTPYRGEFMHRPRCSTLIEQLACDGYRVLNYEIPMTAGLSAPNLISIGSGVGMVEPAPPALQLVKSGGSPWIVDSEKLLQGYVDNARLVMSTIRALIRRDVADIYFVSIREIDSLGHFWDEDARHRLSESIDIELEDCMRMGDDISALWFSDHGAEPMRHAFLMNKWFMDMGWLYLEIFEHGVHAQELQASKGAVPNVLNISSPLVHVMEGSCFLTADAFDAGITVLRDDAPVDALKHELVQTGMIDAVYTPLELYGDGPYVDQLGCDLVCDRSDGVFVSGNVHPAVEGWKDPVVPCMSNLRTGVHTRYGVWGVSDDEWTDDEFGSNEGVYRPHEFYAVVDAYCRDHAEKGAQDHVEEDPAVERARELGYGGED